MFIVVYGNGEKATIESNGQINFEKMTDDWYPNGSPSPLLLKVAMKAWAECSDLLQEDD